MRSTMPRMITIRPLTWASGTSCASKTRPIPEAAAPRATKTMVKPPTNRPIPISRGRLVLAGTGVVADPVTDGVGDPVTGGATDEVAEGATDVMTEGATHVVADVVIEAVRAAGSKAVWAAGSAAGPKAGSAAGSAGGTDPAATNSAAERPETMER
jgi:hypothetical protein